jgi:hypothetical protein
MLSADKAFVADPSLTTEYELLGPGLQLAFARIDQVLPDDLAHLADRLLGLDGTDAPGAASADPAASITPAAVLGEANAVATQTTKVLDSAPTASLDSSEAEVLVGAQQTVAAEQSTLPLAESSQASLPAADQTGLADVDQQLLHADQGLLDAAQGFVSADHAGDLTNLSALDLGLARLKRFV